MLRVLDGDRRYFDVLHQVPRRLYIPGWRTWLEGVQLTCGYVGTEGVVLAPALAGGGDPPSTAGNTEPGAPSTMRRTLTRALTDENDH